MATYFVTLENVRLRNSSNERHLSKQISWLCFRRHWLLHSPLRTKNRWLVAKITIRKLLRHAAKIRQYCMHSAQPYKD